MKKSILVMLLATFCVLAYQVGLVPAAAADGATIAPLDSNWSAAAGPLATPLGKVIYNVPDNRNKMNLTYILQGANPNTDYTVGFNIGKSQTPDCSGADTPSTFGVSRGSVPCPTGSFGGWPDTEALYQVGTLTTDAYGDGDLHINLKGLPSGTFKLLFWVVPCTPPTVCGFVPQAGTGSWAGGGSVNPVLDFETITIP